MKAKDLRLLYVVPLLLIAMAIALATSTDVRADAPSAKPKLETAVFAGGCFWGVEAVFEHVRGVVDAQSGYAGGEKEYANYDDVSSGATGHAEAVQVTYDPAQVSYGQLLSVFFTVAHDPTQLNRQGPDFGPQYRSAIFHHTGAQHLAAMEYVRQLEANGRLGKPVVTQIVPLERFYPAEEHHQDFMRRNPMHPYILAHDRPKVRRLREVFPKLFVEEGLAKR
jgi:peptide-methionine (S)-S-oxide reductase